MNTYYSLSSKRKGKSCQLISTRTLSMIQNIWASRWNFCQNWVKYKTYPSPINRGGWVREEVLHEKFTFTFGERRDWNPDLNSDLGFESGFYLHHWKTELLMENSNFGLLTVNLEFRFEFGFYLAPSPMERWTFKLLMENLKRLKCNCHCIKNPSPFCVQL